MYRFYTVFTFLVFMFCCVSIAQTTYLAPHIARSNAAEFLNIISPVSLASAANETRQVTYSPATFLPMIRPLTSLTLNNFPVSLTESGTIVLQRARSAADANTILLASGVKGKTTIKLPEVLVFRGTVNGEPNSRVTLCTANDEIICSIRREDGNSYTLAPSSESNSAAHYLVSDKVIHHKNDLLQCMTEEAHHAMAEMVQTPSKISSKVAKNLSSNLLEVRIAVECDNKFYKDFNDTNKAAAYAIALISLASLTYEDEVHTVLTIPFLNIWTTPDPYNINGDGIALNDTVRKYWNINHTDIDRDLVHSLTSGGNAGIGLLYPLSNGGASTVICQKEAAYSSSSPFTFHTYPTFDFTYGVYIVSHEIGHNFGAVHSFTCFWNPPFDTCVIQDGINGKCFQPDITVRPNPGSIMSYCPNVNLAAHNNDFSYYRVNMTFLPKIADYMRAQVEGASCIASATKPALVLSYPRGNEKIDASNIVIRWQSAHIQNVKLEYSTNTGVKWEQIIASTPAVDGQFKWYLPVINTTNMTIRVSDVSNENLNDGSVLPFSAKNATGVSEETINNTFDLHTSIIDGQLILEGDLQTSEQNLTVSLYSIDGKEVGKWNVPVSAGHLALKFDVSTIPPGVYNIQAGGIGIRYGKTLMHL
ncbi:MAG: hypothetical protein HYZ54_01760 [Ignavibacteriae bacterium]|nr:hypothetical protein [Ignavibacteriota bacterium]